MILCYIIYTTIITLYIIIIILSYSHNYNYAIVFVLHASLVNQRPGPRSSMALCPLRRSWHGK